MSRHPYTYAADWMRQLIGRGAYPVEGQLGCLLSRSDASRIRTEMCEVLGLDDAEVAEQLSAHFQAQQLND